MMRTPSEKEITSALQSVAERQETPVGPYWRFGDSLFLTTDENARSIARFCLMLGVPVSDVLTSALFGALVDRVAEIERVIALQDAP